MFAICISLLSCLSFRIALHQWQILCRAFLPNCTHKPLAQMAVVCFQTGEKLMWLSQNRAVKTLLNHTFSSQHLLLHRNVCGMHSCLYQQLVLALNVFTRRPFFLTSLLCEEQNWLMPYHLWRFPANLLWPCKTVTFAHETLVTLPRWWILKLFSCLFWTLISWLRAFPFSHNRSLENADIFKVFSQHGLIKATKLLWTGRMDQIQ